MATEKRKKPTGDWIIEKAMELFNRYGVEATSTRSLAARLGISHGHLRYYFPSKEELLLRLFERFTRENDTLLETAFQRPGMDLHFFYEGLLSHYSILYRYRSLFIESVALNRKYPNYRRLLRKERESGKEKIGMLLKLLCEHRLMKQEAYPGQYDDLYGVFYLYSTYWMSEAAVLEPVAQKMIVSHYAKNGMLLFFPCLTPKGVEQYNRWICGEE